MFSAPDILRSASGNAVLRSTTEDLVFISMQTNRVELLKGA